MGTAIRSSPGRSRGSVPGRRDRVCSRHHGAAWRWWCRAGVRRLASFATGRPFGGEYAVDYPASRDFDSSTPAGANDAGSHIQSMAGNCPGTRIVLGGYSQGAGVIDLSTTAMPPQIADHVAAMALFGAPRSAFADTLSPGPLPTIGALYATKTIDLCVPNDPICSDGWDMRAHVAYVETGMTNQAATFAASRL